MIILAIDITTPLGSLAITRDGKMLEETILEGSSGFGEIIFAAIDDLLKRHSLTIADIDKFAAATGPGTFTGVRMGLALVQGLAEALNRPAVGISNLAALAYTGQGPIRAPVLDARRDHYYTGVYDQDGTLLQPEQLTVLEAFHPGVPLLRQTGPLAAVIAALASKRPGANPSTLDANYIRISDAELNLTVRPPLPPHT